jgi:REP-associated tyrosine transposase
MSEEYRKGPHTSYDIQFHVSGPPELSPSKMAQHIKGRSSRLLQQEFPHLKKQYWGKHLWARGYFCATAGRVTEKMIEAYISNQEDARPADVFFKVADE